ncbi:MAG: glycosyltransferase family 2 protein [Ruminococcus sp.]
MEVNKDVLLSIIIPVYNAEKFIDRCLKSITNEIAENTEVVIVDDGSTDNSYEICKSFENQYSSFRVIHKNNEGVSVARNVGIENSRGKYILFLDADDWLETGWNENIKKFLTENWDMTAFAYNVVYSNPQKNYRVSPYENGVLSITDVYKTLAAATYMNFCWGKLINRQFLVENHIYFSVGKKIGEDVDFQIAILENNPKMFYCNFPIINYYQVQSSVMHRFDISKFRDLEREYYLRNDLLKKCDAAELTETEKRMFITLGGMLISYVKQSCEQFEKKDALDLFMPESEKQYFKEIVSKAKFSGKLKNNRSLLLKNIPLLLIKAKRWKLLYCIFRRI